MQHTTVLTATALGCALLGGAAWADDFTVQASGNSTNGGTGLPTVVLTAGQTFSVSAAPTDLWSAGDLPRWSNADGLVGDLYATGMDETGLAFGTQIGRGFGILPQHGFAAPYGALVGNISGSWVLLGTQYSGTAPVDGTLYLFYWDENAGDNTGSLVVSVEAIPTIPEPAEYALLAGGLLVLALRGRARKSS